MRVSILTSVAAGIAALGLAACGASANNAAKTTSTGAPTTPTVVTQVVTKTVRTAPARPNKPKPKPKPRPKPKPKPTPPPPATTSAPVSAGPTMPNVAGKDLDIATGELERDGIRYALNSNGEHVILKFDWGVCSTQPAAGQPVTGVVVLNLGHFRCGA